jgi:hypothetical protein
MLGDIRRLTPGDRWNADECNAIAGMLGALYRSTGGSGFGGDVSVSRAGGGLQVLDGTPRGHNAKIGAGSGAAYAHTQAVANADGTWTSLPARERNGRTDVPAGTRVWVEPAESADGGWLFDFRPVPDPFPGFTLTGLVTNVCPVKDDGTVTGITVEKRDATVAADGTVAWSDPTCVTDPDDCCPGTPLPLACCPDDAFTAPVTATVVSASGDFANPSSSYPVGYWTPLVGTSFPLDTRDTSCGAFDGSVVAFLDTVAYSFGGPPVAKRTVVSMEVENSGCRLGGFFEAAGRSPEDIGCGTPGRTGLFTAVIATTETATCSPLYREYVVNASYPATGTLVIAVTE